MMKKSSFKTKAFRAGGYSTAAAAIVIIIAVVINLIVSNISSAYTNFDTTQSGVYSLSKQTKEMVSELQDEVTIYYIATDSAKMGYVSNLLEKFDSAGKNLKVENINPDTEPNFASAYTDETVSDGDILVVCGEKAQVVHYDEMIEYEAGSYEYYYYYLQYYGEQTDVYWNGEVLLIKAIDFVTADKTYSAYFYDTDDSGDFSVLEEFLTNENINCTTLSADAESIPDSADCVIITGISADLTDGQYGIISDYLKNGGKLYLAADCAEDETPNLDSLMSDFGLSFTSATLEDGDRNYSPESLLYPAYSEHDIVAPFTKANYICFPDAMGILSEEKDNITVSPIITTSESAYLSTDDTDDLQFDTFNLGVFAKNSETGAEIVVYGTSAYTDSEYSEDTTLSNIDLFINSIAYLCDKDSAVTVHAKAITSDTTLDFGDTSTGFLVFLIAVIPALAAICVGFVIWYKRRNS